MDSFKAAAALGRARGAMRRANWADQSRRAARDQIDADPYDRGALADHRAALARYQRALDDADAELRAAIDAVRTPRLTNVRGHARR